MLFASEHRKSKSPRGELLGGDHPRDVRPGQRGTVAQPAPIAGVAGAPADRLPGTGTQAWGGCLRGATVSSTGEVVGAGCGVGSAEVGAVDVVDDVDVDCADVVDEVDVDRVVRVGAETCAALGEALGAVGEDEAVGAPPTAADAGACIGPSVTARPRPPAPARSAKAAASVDAPRALPARPGFEGFGRPGAAVAGPGRRPSTRWSEDSTRSSEEDVATRIGPAVGRE